MSGKYVVPQNSGSTKLTGLAILLVTLRGVALLSNDDSIGNHHQPTIKHLNFYDKLNYDLNDLKRQHHVAKRSNQHVQVTFDAFGRKFLLRLKRETTTFHPSVTMEIGNETIGYETSRVYTGVLQDMPSKVHGVVTKGGHFEGRIVTSNETYFIERSQFHFQEEPAFHSVIYRLSDVTFDPGSALCGADDLHRKQLKMQRHWSRVDDIDTSQKEHETWDERYTQSTHDYMYDLHDDIESRNGHHGNSRHRRAVPGEEVICELYMKADHLFYQQCGSDTDTVIDKLTQHVQALNTIYNPIDFDDDGQADNIGFIIKRIKIYTDASAEGYKFPGNYGVESFLDLHSQENYDSFCLSYLFTHRDFDNGVLGLAWVGDTSAPGGVCEKFAAYSGESKSLNTGIVSTLNYGSFVPTAVSYVTFAHEVGHNFGSNHDDEGNSLCSPGGSQGNFIMYARATSGTQPNNGALSQCSITSIHPVIQTKGKALGKGCFEQPADSLCGNRVVEGLEECDCGWTDECNEGCCNPQDSSPSPGVEPCERPPTASCSPSEGPCCKSDCQLYETGDNQVCRPETSCQQQAICSGSNISCPASVSKSDATQCEKNKVCYNGECSGAICEAHGRVRCQCSPATPGDFKDTILCKVCCLDDAQVCKPSAELTDIPNTEALPGAPCYDFKGYCDVFLKCRAVDPSGPLSNLKKLILSGEAIETLKTFFTQHWYIGVAIGVGLIVSIALVVKFCSKTHKDSDFRLSPRRGEPGVSSRNQVSPDRWM